MIKFINDNGIVINKVDFGEADRYITVFTENFGKLTFLLKGIRKSKKRDLSSVDILTFSKFIFYKKGENYIISSCQSVESYMGLKEDLEKLGISLYITALLNSILVDGNRKKNLYKITEKTLNYLQENREKKVDYVLLGYYLHYLIKDEGLKIFEGKGYYFSFEKSTFIQENEEFSIKISPEEKDILLKYGENKVKELKEDRYLLKDIKRVISFFEKYISYHLGTNLKLKNYTMGVENE